ncbi:putative Lipoprotein [Pseudomonas batumici]|uniref:Putative Lipoprotein n=2 Tax=Pseudomonas batumici TaxID=226910 RepID=A0A0C2EFF4_9PSED|nr:putative Lipoprotein [Pseudomonas batumici]
MMRAARSLMIFALPLFAAGCQWLAPATSHPTAGLSRMQGELASVNGKMMFQPCQEQRHFVVSDSGNTSVLQQAASLSGPSGKLFADLRGRFSSSTVDGSDGQVDLQQYYRLERGTGSCDDPDFKRQTVVASGHGPDWSLKASGNGMVLERENQPALVLPYLEEQLGDGRFSLSTEANAQRIELWVAPQPCVDSSTGSVRHLSAELRVNGQVQRGCGYFGGARND